MLEREFDRFGAIQKIEHNPGDTQAFIQYESIDAATVSAPRFFNSMNFFSFWGSTDISWCSDEDEENLIPEGFPSLEQKIRSLQKSPLD